MDQIRAKLKEAIKTRGAIGRMAKSAGISKAGLRKIIRGDTVNPGVMTIERVERALREEMELQNVEQKTGC